MIRVPENSSSLIAGSSDGETVNSLTSLLDIYPTLIELAGIKNHKQLDGKSLVPLLNEPKRFIERPIITTYDFADYSVRWGDWHYINYVDGKEELYNIKKDKEEWYNLSNEGSYYDTLLFLKNFIPLEPTPLPKESLLELMEHHIPPVISREYYFSDERKNWLERFKN